MAGKGDIDIGINVRDAGVAAAVDAIFNGAEGAVNDFNKLLGIEVQKKLVVETFFDPSTAQKGIRVVERDVNNLGSQIEKLAEKSKKLEFGSATSLKGQLREATQARDQIRRYEESVGVLGQKVLTVNQAWAAQNARVQELSRQLSIASANGFWAKAKAGLNLQGLSNFSNGLVAVTQGLQSASILIGQVIGSFNQLFTALAKIQQFELSFKAIGASAGETSLAFQESERIALGLGVGIQTVRDAFQQLSPVILASGGSIGDVSAITESLSSRFAAFGLSADKARRVTNGVIQAFGKGKLQAEELTQQISEADPAFRIDLASAIGVSVAELGELVKAGEITSDRLIEILPLLSKSSLLFGKLGDSGASAANALAKGTITITQARTQLDNLNQLSFEQLARAFEPFLTALIRVQAAFVDFGTAISNATALKVFGEFLGQLTSQAGGVIDVIGKIALTFLSIIEAVGNVINAIDNFTESIGGIRVVVTGLAALITTKLVVSLLRLGVTLGTTIVTSIAKFAAGIAAGGVGISGLAASIGKGIASIFGLDSASLKLIATNFKTIASTGGVTASLKGLAAGATTAAASILGAGSANAAPWLADIAKQATNGAQEIGKLAPATQLVIPGLTATGEAAKTGEAGLKALGSATQLPIPGLNATNEAVKAYTKGTLEAFLQSQQGAAGITQVANAAKDGVPAFIPYTAAIQGAGGAAAGLGPAAVAGAAGVGAAGTAAGAATAPTLTFAGAVSAANASLTAGIKAVLAFGAALLTNPITATIIGISALAAGVFFLNKAFSGSEASIKSFDEGIKGIKERSEKAIAAIDAAGDSAVDFEERIKNLEVTPEGLSETAEIFNTFPALVKSATGEFKQIEKEATGFFEKAEKAVAKYNKEQDKTGKGALKVAQIISDSENAVQLALETTKRKRAELEEAATKTGGPISEENKKLLIGYNENIKALERKKLAIEDLKATAVASGIEIPVTTVDQTKATLDGIKSKIETLKSNIVLELDPRKLDAASSKLEFLKFELEFLEKDRYQLQVELEYKINESALQAQLDITDAQKTNIEAQLGLQRALLSVDEARLTAQEKALSDQIEGLKKAGASSQEIYDLELKLKGLANEKLELKRRAVKAELDALPKIQEAEKRSLELQQKLKQIELEKTQAALKRLENEAKIAQLQSRGDLAKEQEKERPDNAKIRLLTDEVNLRQEILGSIGQEKKVLENAISAQASLNELADQNLRLKQETDRANLNAKAIEVGVGVDARGAAPASVKVPVEFIPTGENDLERQIRELSGRQRIDFEFTPNTDKVEDETSRLENQGLEIDSSVTPPETSELQKELDELQKGGLRIETSLGEPNTNETYATIGNLESEKIEIISDIVPPDPAPITSTVQELNNENVEIGAGFEVPGTEGVLEKVGELEDIDVKIQSGINPLDTDAVSDKIDELQDVKVQIPSGIENPDTSFIDQVREENEGTPIEIPVNVGTVQGADGVTNLDGGLLEITPVIGELDTTEVEGQLEELSNLVPAITPLVEAPDTSETRGVLQDLESTSPIIPVALGQLDESLLRGSLDAFEQTGLEINPSLNSLDASKLEQELDALKGDIFVPASIEPRVENESEVEATLNRLARPIESSAKYRIENEAELASNLDEAFGDRTINVGADITEAEQAVIRLKEQDGVIGLNFGVPDDREVEQRIGELEQRKVEVETYLEDLNTDDAYNKINNLEEEIVDIASSIKPLDATSIEAEIDRLNREQVQIESGLGTPDDRNVQAKVQEIKNGDVEIPSSILDPGLSGIEETRRGLEGDPIVIPVKVGPVEGGDNLAGPDGTTIQIDTVLNTADADKKLEQLGSPSPEVSVIVTSPDTSAAERKIDSLGKTEIEIEPILKPVDDFSVKGQLEELRQSDVKIDTRLGRLDDSEAIGRINALKESNIVVPAEIDLKYEALDLGREVDSIRNGLSVDLNVETVAVETELNRLEQRKLEIELGVIVPETGELDRINSQLNALEARRNVIDIKYDVQDPGAILDLTRESVNVPVRLETIEIENELRRLAERKRQIQFGVASEPGELEAVENELQELEERRRIIQVAYGSPDPEAINELDRDLEARNLELKTSLQAPDPTQVNAELSRLRSTQVQFKPTVAPLPTGATKVQAAALATTPVQLKSSIASLPTEPTKAEAAALASTPIRFNPAIAPVPVEEARAELSELGNTQVVITPVVNPPDTTIAKTELASLSAPVNVPLTVNADTVQAKTALTEVRTEGDAIQSSIANATAATTSLGGRAQEAVSPFGALGAASANLLQSSNTIDQNFEGIGSAATAAVTPMSSLNTSLVGASTNSLAAATSVGNLSTNASGAVGVFDELLTQTTGISDSAARAAESTDLIKTGFDDVNTAATTAAKAASAISENLSSVRESFSDAATSSETLATAFSESVPSSATLRTNTANVATEASRVVTQTDAMYVDIRDSVGVTNTLIGRLNAAARAAASIRIPSGGNNYFAGGPVQGGAAYTVNEFGKEMFLSNSGRLSQINAPAWGTWRAPSSGTIIPAHIASGIDIPKGGVKVSKPSGSLSSSSVKKNGSGLGRVITNLVNALNASRASQKNNDNAIQATQAIQIGKLTQAVNKLVDKDWNVGVNIQGQNGGLSYARAINRKI